MTHKKNIKKPRLLIVSEKIPPQYSGAGTSAILIAKFYNKKQHLFKLLTTSGINKNGEKSELDEHKIKRFSLFVKYNSIENYPFLKLIISFLKIPYYVITTGLFITKNRNSFDIAFFVSYSWFTFFVAFFCKFYKKKYILETTLPGQDDPFGYHSERFKFFKRIMKSFIFNNAEKVTNISSALTEKCKQFGIAKNKIYTIPRTVNETHFKTIHNASFTILKNKLNIPEKAFPVILFAGVLNLRKGIDIVYKTYIQLRARFPDILLILAGENHQNSFVKRIDFEIETNKENSKILKLGHIHNVHEYMAISDLFFLPSRREGFGRVFIEAMAAGLTVVCKKISGVTDDIFKNNYNGIVIDSENEYDFCMAIENICSNKEKRLELASNAIKIYNERFSNKIVFEKYDKLFELNN